MTDIPTHWQSSGPAHYTAHLPGGDFTFALSREDVPLRDICDLALRNNARRRFLFVSRVLGRHHPVRPAALRSVARQLAEKLHARLADQPVVFIGMAETATTLGQAVFREWVALQGRGLYIESTRRRTGSEVALGFAEVHSHATAHALHLPGDIEDPEHWLQTAAQIVIVDDEATTGRTAAGLVRAIQDWRNAACAEPVPFSATLAVLLNWNPCASEGVDPAITHIESLVEGRFDFTPIGEFPTPPHTQVVLDTAVQCRRGVRHGTVRPEVLPGHWATLVHAGHRPEATGRPNQELTSPTPRVLVIGNGEYGFHPLLLAEALESTGAQAWVQATTRSPILLGGAIQHHRSFPALSGEGYTEHLYNVPDDHDYDRVIVCTEDALPPADHPLWRLPRVEVCTWANTSPSPERSDWIATDLDGSVFSRHWATGSSGRVPVERFWPVPGTWRQRDAGITGAAVVGDDQPPNPQAGTEPTAALSNMESHREPSSWVPAATHRLLVALSRAAALVPVTARDAESFARVDVPLLHLRGPAILANGAIVLDWNGQPDAEWQSRMSALLEPWTVRLETLCAKLIERTGNAARPRLVESQTGLPAYLVAKAAPGWWTSPEGVVIQEDKDLWAGCRIAVLGTELQALPGGLGKREATLFVQEKYFAHQAPLLCLGDMPTDLAFMRLSGLLAVPAGSNLEGTWQQLG